MKDKVTGTITYVNSSVVNGMEVYQKATGDTILWNGSDSLDFSQPVYFKVKAYDGLTTKLYEAWINIHQVIPDSMAWSLVASLPAVPLTQKALLWKTTSEEKIYMYMQAAGNAAGYRLFCSPVGDPVWTEASLSGLPESDLVLEQMVQFDGRLYVSAADGQLYASSDGLQWQALENAPAVKALYGAVGAGEKQTPALTAVVETAAGLQFAAMNGAQEWTLGNALPADFPMTGFATSTYSSMHREYLLAVAGRDQHQTLLNSVWGTMDGLDWVSYSDEEQPQFSEREGVMMTPYDDRLFLIGGLDAEGNGLSDVYVSTDHGLTWAVQDTLVTMPENFQGRGAASVVVDQDQFLYLLGGKAKRAGSELDEVWRGRINRLGFAK